MPRKTKKSASLGGRPFSASTLFVRAQDAKRKRTLSGSAMSDLAWEHGLDISVNLVYKIRQREAARG